MSLISDIADAVVDAIDTNIASFSPALGGTGRVQYARDGLQTIPAGNQGRAYVIVNEPIPEGGDEYTDSQLMNFSIDVVFDIAGTNAASEHLAAGHVGMISTFADGGANFRAEFGTTNANIPGNNGRVSIESSQIEPSEDPARPRVRYTLSFRAWHTVPLT